MFKTEPPKHRCTVTAEDYFLLDDRIKELENKLSEVAVNGTEASLGVLQVQPSKTQTSKESSDSSLQRLQSLRNHRASGEHPHALA